MKKFLSKFENRMSVYSAISGMVVPSIGIAIASYSIVLSLIVSVVALFGVILGFMCLDYLLIESKRQKG